MHGGRRGLRAKRSTPGLLPAKEVCPFGTVPPFERGDRTACRVSPKFTDTLKIFIISPQTAPLMESDTKTGQEKLGKPPHPVHERWQGSAAFSLVP